MRFWLLLITVLAAPLSAAPFTVVETGKSYPTLQDAVGAVGEGVGTVLIAPGRYRDCAIQQAGRLTYRARTPLTAIFDGGICEGKAVLVLRGASAIVDGLVFENLKVDDGNGAGIRIEKGPLIVVNSLFRNSEEGILGGGDDAASDLIVDRSTFSGLGRCDRGLSCAHSIYMGAYRSVIVRRSRFEKGRGGHYLKSRAARIEVTDCSFDDSAGRTTNYMIDLSEGATGRIARNVMVQGSDKENHSAFVAVAAEGQRHSSAGLIVVDNRAHQVTEAAWPTALLMDWSGSPKQVSGNLVGTHVGGHQPVKVEPPSFTNRAYRWLRGKASDVKTRLLG